jgi:hypothetical protein
VPQELSAVLADYGAGLDAALQLLTQLEALSARQHALPNSPAPDPDAMQALMAERQRLLDGLSALETQLRPLRERIASDLATARAVPGFQVVAERHRAVTATVGRIMALDQESLDALQEADARRRADVHAVETAGATLAAYRRVLEGPQGSAGLVDQRG